MKFTIAGKECELKFGLKFIRQLDEVYKVDYQGLEFGMGINLAYMNLRQRNPVAISELIRAAVSHESNPPKLKFIDDAVEEYALQHDGLGQLFEDLLEQLGKSALVKDTLKQFEATAKTAEKTEED